MSWVRPQHRKRWENMVGRCYSPKHQDFEAYGARGIKVCKEWREDWRTFQSWCFGTYQRGKTLDRVDNNGPYSPGNCCWSTAREQASNRRKGTQAFWVGRKETQKKLHARYGDPKTRTHKKCGHCRKTFSLVDFYSMPANPDGRSAWCKFCHRERDRNRPKKRV